MSTFTYRSGSIISHSDRILLLYLIFMCANNGCISKIQIIWKKKLGTFNTHDYHIHYNTIN